MWASQWWGEKEKRQEGLCQMWGVNEEAEGAGREVKRHRLGRRTADSSSRPDCLWGRHASAQATVPHCPLKVHTGAFCLLLPYLIIHTPSSLPKSPPVTCTHFTLANAMLSKNSSLLVFQCVCPGASVQRICRLPHLPLF